MTLKEFLTAFLGKTLNMPAEKVASLLNDEGTEAKPEALDALLALDATRVGSFKTENQNYFDNGVKKATKEIMQDFEKGLKEKFGIASDKKGTELIEEIVSTKTKAGDLDANKVKLHPLYLELEAKMNTAVKEVTKTWEEKYQGFEKQVAKEKTFSGVIKKADQLLGEFELPKDEKLRENQKRLLVAELEKFGYQVNGDELIVLDGDGKPVEDGHGNRKSFDTIVKESAANYWPKLSGQQKSGAGGSNDQTKGGAAGSAWKGKVPSNEDEYSTMLAQAKTPEERIALTDAYDSVQGAK